jgi:hypothetical protein
VDPEKLDALRCQVCQAEIRDEKGFPDFERRFCSERVRPQCMKTYRTWMMRTKRAKERVDEFTVRFGSGYVLKAYTKESAEAAQKLIEDYEMRFGPVKVKAKGAGE